MNYRNVIVFFLLLTPLVSSGEKASVKTGILKISPVNPFEQDKADNLKKDIITAEKSIHAKCFLNDWILAAVKVNSEEEIDITAGFEGSSEFSSAVQLSVIGEIQAADSKGTTEWYLDPVFKKPEVAGDLSESGVNGKRRASLRIPDTPLPITIFPQWKI